MTLVFDRRGEVIAAVYGALLTEPSERALAREYRFTAERFYAEYATAVTVGLELDDALVGGMFFIAKRVHLGILPVARSRWVKCLEPMLAVGFAAFGNRLIARVGVGNARARRFVEAVGCVLRHETPHYLEYEVCKERMRYVRYR